MKTIENTVATDTVAELLQAARRAHQSIQAEPAAALTRAFEAGDALTAAKKQVPRGEWTSRLETTGIPPSTARLYMQLSRHRDRIVAAGCTSIREARRLLAGTKPRAPRASGRPRGEAPVDDRYQEGYADGYRAGRADGYAAGQTQPRPTRNGRDPLPLDEKDLKWLITFVHPDKHQGKGELKATRVTQWLVALLDRADRR